MAFPKQVTQTHLFLHNRMTLKLRGALRETVQLHFGMTVKAKN